MEEAGRSRQYGVGSTPDAGIDILLACHIHRLLTEAPLGLGRKAGTEWSKIGLSLHCSRVLVSTSYQQSIDMSSAHLAAS